jgi:predicted cupin superfamily sugar epimerase
MNDAASIISQLELLPHPEGGWFRETYRSEDVIPDDSLPDRYKSQHCFSTSIYFLLESHNFSAFHRISSDETWHFYLGSPVVIYIISQEGDLAQVTTGNNLSEGQCLQYTIPRNCWFAAKVVDKNSFTLVGCTVAPGFEFGDFELASRKQLSDLYPVHADLISGLTR